MQSISKFSNDIMELRYSRIKEDGTKETWEDIAHRVVKNIFKGVSVPKDIPSTIEWLISERKFIPGGRFLAQTGRDYHQTNNCFLLRAEDTREGWGELMNKAAVMLMSGGGIGIDYSDLRGNGTKLRRSGGTASGPIPLIKSINEIGRGVMSGGNRRSAIYGSLRWNHPDIYEFIKVKNWSEDVKRLKESDFDFPASLDMTNISVILDKDFFEAYDADTLGVRELYNTVIDQMCKTGEPGFQIDFNNKRESLRNACTEVVSEDDCDVCCLGSINLANISSIDELEWVTNLATLFLLVGTEYSDVPVDKVKTIKEANRRLGTGLMGLHEWMIQRGLSYGKSDELAEWLKVWKESSDIAAGKWANHLSFNIPIAKRAIAPNGTISIAGGHTTSGIEPIFATAYQRRYLTGNGWKKQYVVDFVAEKLHELGIDPEKIEDAYSLSLDVERRIEFQAFVQEYVDNAISSTINLQSFGKPGNDNPEEFGSTLYKYLPKLRGITAYPDGARGGQPLTPVGFNFALSKKGLVLDSHEECVGGICGL